MLEEDNVKLEDIINAKKYHLIDKSIPSLCFDRVRDFCNYLKENFDRKAIAVVAHKAPQFAL